jgi:PAS domain S-box-containing protein
MTMSEKRPYEELVQRVGELEKQLSEQKSTEDALQKRFNRIVRECGAGYFFVDLDGRWREVNEAWLRMHGFSSSEEVIGKHFSLTQVDVEKARRTLDRVLSGESLPAGELSRRRKDGSVAYHWFSASPVFQDGKIIGCEGFTIEYTEQKRSEDALRRAKEQLDRRIEERTNELLKANERLKAQSRHLKELNTALKVLLKQRENDKTELQENVLSNVKKLVIPYLERLKKTTLDRDQLFVVEALETNLKNIISPFVSKLSSKMINLTPMEIRVANLIKDGKTNKEMADFLCVSENTILFHRYNIRGKLELKNTKINLRSYLSSFE